MKYRTRFAIMLLLTLFVVCILSSCIFFHASNKERKESDSAKDNGMPEITMEIDEEIIVPSESEPDTERQLMEETSDFETVPEESAEYDQSGENGIRIDENGDIELPDMP